MLWEILSRTEADDEGSVPEYKMPFEEEVGVVPTLGDMRMIVVGRKTRPEFRMELLMTAVFFTINLKKQQEYPDPRRNEQRRHRNVGD